MRTTTGRGSTSTLEALVRAAHSANAERANLRVVSIQESQPSLQPLEILGRCIGQLPESRYEALRIFGGALRDPHLFVIPKANDYGVEWWDRLVDLVDYAAKTATSGALAVIAIDDRSLLSLNPTYDFRNGKPVGKLLSFASSAPVVMWQAYLHHRIAWEVAGNLDLAYRLDDALGGIAVGEENALEASLNGFADALAAENQAGLKELDRALAVTVRDGAARDPRHGESDDIRALELAGFLWPSEGRRGMHITPWAARALARTTNGLPYAWQTRAAMVCMPLAGELLETCFELESRIRSSVLSRGVANAPSETTEEHFTRFIDGKDGVISYPRQHPAIPSDKKDIWAFASLGEVLKATNFFTPDAFWQTLYLRNAVAHGHYVCWHHITKAVQLMRTVA